MMSMRSLSLLRQNLSFLFVLVIAVYGFAFDSPLDFGVPVAYAMWPALPAVIGAVGAIGSAVAGSAMSNSASNKLNKEQMRFEQEMYYRKLRDQRALINDERSYNDPSAQVQRLRAAGINPALALQQGNVGSGLSQASTSPPSSGSPQWKMSNAPDYIAQIPDALAQMGQAIVAREQQQKTAADTEQVHAQTAGIKIENEYKRQQILSQLRNDMVNRSKTAWERRLAKQQYEWMNRTEQLRYTQLEDEHNKNVKEQDWIDEQINASQAKTKIDQMLADSRVKVDQATIRNLHASTDQLSALAASIREATKRDNNRYYTFEQFRDEIDLHKLQETAEDFIKQSRSAGLISEEQYKQALEQTKRMTTETYWYNFLHGQDNTSSFNHGASLIVGGLSLGTELFGNIFGGALGKVR